MKRILFVCHGNFCRSPMAEFIFRDMVKKAGLEAEVQCSSAATSDEDVGRDMYSKARKKLQECGVPFEKRSARQIVRKDYDAFDHIIGMEERNAADMRRYFGGDPDGKICLLLDFTDRPRDIADPWYTDDFDVAYREVREGCEALLRRLQSQL